MTENDDEGEEARRHRNAITNAQKVELRNYYQSNPGLTYKALASWFEDLHGRKINLSSISRILSSHYAFLDDPDGYPVHGKR